MLSDLVINKPSSMWKKCKIQWGMGMVNSQDQVIGVGSLDRFDKMMLFMKRCQDQCTW